MSELSPNKSPTNPFENGQEMGTKFSNLDSHLKNSSLEEHHEHENNFDFNFEQIKNYRCNNHEEAMEFFCLSCEEPICKMCIKLGPHQNKLHHCINLKEAVEKRKQFIIEILSNEYKKKIEKIIDHMQAVRLRGEEVSTVENVIENDIHYEFNGILDRLAREEGKKISILQKEISFLQRDVNNIDDLINSFVEVMQKNDPVNFLLICKDIMDYAENLHAKSFKKTIDIYPYDLPRETSDIKTQMSNQKTLQLLSDFKDSVILKIINQIKADEALSLQQLIPEKLKELTGWVRLCENFGQEFYEFQMVCFYCAEILKENSINSPCYVNRLDFEMPKNFQGYTEKTPKFKHRGNDRHYFHKPKKEFLILKQDAYPTLSDYESAERLYNNLFSIFKIEIFKIHKKCFEEGRKIQEVFEKIDKEKKGKLKPIQFKYILSESFELATEQIEKVTSFFLDKNGLVPYVELIQIIEKFNSKPESAIKPEFDPFEEISKNKTSRTNYFSPIKNDNFAYGSYPSQTKSGKNNYSDQINSYYSKYLGS